jgi:hypothetical protein
MTSVTLFGEFRGVPSRCELEKFGWQEQPKGKNDLAAATKTAMAEDEMNIGHYDDMQSAPRFPLHLAASVKAQGAAYSAETENISANGVLFAMDSDVPVGSLVDFTIMLPAEVLGARQNVQIDCRGRVVRSFEDRGRRGVGVVIDEYHFERA